MDTFWIILTGCLVAANCALTGVFLVMRRMSMLGDAISHAVLPGIAIAFLLSGSRAGLPVLIGAASFGLLATWLIEFFHSKARMYTDAAIGLSFTMLFAIGVIIINYFADMVDLDADCVLHGEIAFVPLDTTSIFNMQVPRAVVSLTIVLCMVLALFLIGFKGLFLTSFDPAYAASIGVLVGLWHYVLMGFVSLVTVVSFESVGAVLVVAFLIVPPATAYMLSDDFKVLVLLALILGCTAASPGYFLSWWVDGSVAAAMTVVLGFQFLLAFLFSPHNGILPIGRRKKFKGIH